MEKREELPKLISFPEVLTAKDRELILQQCENQMATSQEQIEGFATAYSRAKVLAGTKERLDALTPDEVLQIIREYGALAEKRNSKGFRTTEVTFAGGGMALRAALIENVLTRYAETYAENRFSPTEAYKEFEDIHPFEDGNGRVGDLLWKIIMQRQTGMWPEELPPDVYGAASYKAKRQSAFGEIEE